MVFQRLKKKLITFLILFYVLSFYGVAQETGSLFFLSGVSQSSLLNPAFQNKADKLVIGVPLISGVQLGWNSNFSINSIFSSDFSSYSFARFYDSLKEPGSALFTLNISMFYASLKKDDRNYTFSVTDRAFATTTFSPDIIQLIRDGNMAYYGTNTNFGSGSFHFNYYRQLALGISKNIWEDLDIGFRPKILLGRFCFDARNINFSVETVSEKNELLLKPEGQFIMSGPLQYKYDEEKNLTTFSANAVPGDYFMNLRNMGLAFDAGLVFRPGKNSEISLAVLDIGLIGYKHKTYEVAFSQPIRYNTGNLYQSLDTDASRYLEPKEALKAFGDSVSYVIQAQKPGLRTFTRLPFKITLAGKYFFNESIHAGIFDQFSYYKNQSVNRFSGFINYNFSKIELSGSATLHNVANLWVGLAAAYSAEFVQFYAASYNILGIVQPTSANNLNLCLGINFLFETKKK